MKFKSSDYADITKIILDKTYPFTNGRTISFLEGGYNTSALKEAVIEHCGALAT
jgi:acetoin utilization deacetylase AcuC-like enzyme